MSYSSSHTAEKQHKFISIASEASANWRRIDRVFNSNFDNPDMEAVRAVYAAFAAHALPGQPVWPMLVGPPGSLKTVLLMTLEGLPATHVIDQVTPKTFISGYRPDDSDGQEQPSGLLARIGKSGKIICPDFSTILAINRDNRASILSDLRRIYDGGLRKEYGTGGDLRVREWRGRITFLAAGTSDVDRHYAIFGSLGERFVLVRWPRAGFEAAKLAIKHNMPVVQQLVSEAVRPLFDDLEGIDPALLPVMEDKRIPALGDFIAYCRTPIGRNSRGDKSIIDVPEAESATRISQQLCQLAKGSALLDRRRLVNEADFQLAVRVGLDCIPPPRRKVLSPYLPGPIVSLPDTTRRYVEEELVALGVLNEEEHELSEWSMARLEMAGVI